MAREDMFPAPSSAPPGSQDPTDRYQIKRGDNLTKIAQSRLGPNANPKDVQAMIQRIAKENGITDINRIQAGANLRMPANAVPPSAPAPGAAPLDESLAGAPKPGMPLPSAPPPPPAAMPYAGPRGGEIPKRFPVPMPGAGPTITPPTAGPVTSPGMAPRMSLSQAQMDETLGQGAFSPRMSLSQDQMDELLNQGQFLPAPMPPGVIANGGGMENEPPLASIYGYPPDIGGQPPPVSIDPARVAQIEKEKARWKQGKKYRK